MNEAARNRALAYTATRCNGVCLPAVTHDGVRLPVERIIETLRSAAATGFVMVDAAQGLGHVPTEIGIDGADLVVAGVHKWVGAGMPMGVGFGRRTVLEALSRSSEADPLYTLTSPYGIAEATEMANLWPLICCNATVASSNPRRKGNTGTFAARLANRRAVLQLLQGSEWTPVLTHQSLRSGIVLFAHQKGSRQQKGTPDYWLSHFRKCGIAVSTYPRSLIRASLPARRLSASELDRITAAL